VHCLVVFVLPLPCSPTKLTGLNPSVASSSIDVEFFRFMVDALREYYPGVLGSMLLLEKPWFKSGLYNLARHWLSDTVG
jgi:hypothetical protein